MLLKKEPRKKILIFTVNSNKRDFLLKHVKIHVFYVKTFLTKLDISRYIVIPLICLTKLAPELLDISHIS